MLNGCFVNGQYRCTVAFTTGAASGGYTLNSATLQFRDELNSGNVLGDIVVTVHADNSGIPASSTLTTLSGANPSTAGQHTFTCTTGCNLAANTTYFIQATATAGTLFGGQYYDWVTTQSHAETLVPANNGWSVANELDFHNGSNWVTYADDIPKLKIDAATR